MVWKTAHTWLSKGANLATRVTIGRGIGLIAVCAIALAAASCGDDNAANSDDEMVAFAQQPGLHAQVLDSRDMPYAIDIPTTYNASTDLPLILALHWGGEITPYVGGQFLTTLVLPALENVNAILVAPDAVSGDWSNATAEADLLALMNAIQLNYHTASGKTIIVGYSMGGAGVWYMAERHPELFAGAIPIAARPPADALDVSWNVPLFLIHSRADSVIDFGVTETVYNGLFEKDLDVTLLAVTGLGHYDVSDYTAPLTTAGPWIETHLE